MPRQKRLVKRPRFPRGAYISLFVSLAAAALVFSLWIMWPKNQVIRPREPRLSDSMFTWRCLDGHPTFRASGQPGSLPCPTCGKPAYVRDWYRCPEHGTFEVFVRFPEDYSAAAPSFELRLKAGAWVSASKGLTCPKCGRRMQRVLDDPVSRGQPHTRP